jgi:hypothetical protein
MNKDLNNNDIECYVQIMDVNGQFEYSSETYLTSDDQGTRFFTDEKDYDFENSKNTFTRKWLKKHWDRYFQFKKANMLKFTEVVNNG